MADTKLTALTAQAGAVVDADLFYGVDDVAGTPASVKVTALQVKTYASLSPTLVTPTLGVAAGTSIALGGATIGANALAVTGNANISGLITTGGNVVLTGGNFINWASTTLLTSTGEGGFAVYDPGFTRSASLFADGASVLGLRSGTTAHGLNWYDTWTSSTDYHRGKLGTARATLSAVSGASVTATGLIPDGAVVVGVTSKVTTGLGTSNGTTGYAIGTGADPNRWGDIVGTASGTSSDNRDWTSGLIDASIGATDVIVTAAGGNFDGTGVIYLSVQYLIGQSD